MQINGLLWYVAITIYFDFVKMRIQNIYFNDEDLNIQIEDQLPNFAKKLLKVIKNSIQHQPNLYAKLPTQLQNYFQDDFKALGSEFKFFESNSTTIEDRAFLKQVTITGLGFPDDKRKQQEARIVDILLKYNLKVKGFYMEEENVILIQFEIWDHHCSIWMRITEEEGFLFQHLFYDDVNIDVTGEKITSLMKKVMDSMRGYIGKQNSLHPDFYLTLHKVLQTYFKNEFKTFGTEFKFFETHTKTVPRSKVNYHSTKD